MFIGQYEHNLEEKGRLSVPKKFRNDLVDGGVLTRGLDNCLFLFPKKRWEEFMSKLSQTPLTKADARGFSRLLTYYLNYDRSIRLDSLNCFGIPTNKTKSGKIHYHHPNTTQENVSVLCTSHAEAYLALNNSPRDSFANIGVRAVRERTYQK